jgi:hypothetical protein
MRTFQILDTNVGTLGVTATLVGATSAVLVADRPLIKHETDALTIQIPPKPQAGFSFLFRGVQSRRDRPNHPASCPICLGTIRKTPQHYASIALPDWTMVILGNPFPYFANCVTWAVADHVPQICGESRARRGLAADLKDNASPLLGTPRRGIWL